MALHKRYEIVPSDPDHRMFLSVQDFRAGRDEGRYVEVTITDSEADQGTRDMGFGTLTVWLTTDELAELHAVTASLLGVVTSEVEAMVGD